jgi:hypothetical protein
MPPSNSTCLTSDGLCPTGACTHVEDIDCKSYCISGNGVCGVGCVPAQDSDCSAAPVNPSLCTDECNPGLPKQCSTTGGYLACGNFDSDTCLEWSSPFNCPEGFTCQNGDCLPRSEDGNLFARIFKTIKELFS